MTMPVFSMSRKFFALSTAAPISGELSAASIISAFSNHRRRALEVASGRLYAAAEPELRAELLEDDESGAGSLGNRGVALAVAQRLRQENSRTCSVEGHLRG